MKKQIKTLLSVIALLLLIYNHSYSQSPINTNTNNSVNDNTDCQFEGLFHYEIIVNRDVTVTSVLSSSINFDEEYYGHSFYQRVSNSINFVNSNSLSPGEYILVLNYDTADAPDELLDWNMIYDVNIVINGTYVDRKRSKRFRFAVNESFDECSGEVIEGDDTGAPYVVSDTHDDSEVIIQPVKTLPFIQSSSTLNVFSNTDPSLTRIVLDNQRASNPVKLFLISMVDNSVRSILKDEFLSQGKHLFNTSEYDLQPGLYKLVMIQGNTVETKSILKIN